VSTLEQDIDALHRLGLKWMVAFQGSHSGNIAKYARCKDRLRSKILRKYGTVEHSSTRHEKG
jgi:hypothetical protein